MVGPFLLLFLFGSRLKVVGEFSCSVSVLALPARIGIGDLCDEFLVNCGASIQQ